MKITRHTLTLCCIFLLAFFLRVYMIGQVPVSLYWDEVAIGYNAYSIIETGKDEFGNFFPLLFRSFDDYKMPGYIYITALFVKVFGLSEFSVRFPSALLGVFSVLVTYLLVRTILSTEKIRNTQVEFLQTQSANVSLLAAGLLAISPWHIQFSRTGFEANAGLFFILLGFLFLFKGFKRSLYIIVSFFVFSISFYFYRSVIIFLPLILGVTITLFFSELFIHKKKYILLAGVIFIITLIPILIALSSKEGIKRFSQVSSSASVDRQVTENALKIQARGNSLFDRVIYNRRVVYTQTYVKNYLSHFSPQFLTLAGEQNGRHHVVGMGQLYIWEGIFLVIGLYAAFFLPRKTRIFLLAWLLLSPIPAAFSFPTPHALRSLYMLPVLQIFIALGLFYCYINIRKKYQKVLIYGITLVAVICLSRYLYLYYIVTPNHTASDWGDGYKQLVTYTSQQKENYEKIIVSGHYWQPYIYFLFYNKYNPSEFQTSGSPITFDTYYFGGTSWDQDKHRLELDNGDLRKLVGNKKGLLALSPEEYEKQKVNLKKITSISDSFGNERFIISQLKEEL